MAIVHIEFENKTTGEIIERTMECDDSDFADIVNDCKGSISLPPDLRERGFLVVNAY